MGGRWEEDGSKYCNEENWEGEGEGEGREAETEREFFLPQILIKFKEGRNVPRILPGRCFLYRKDLFYSESPYI